MRENIDLNKLKKLLLKLSLLRTGAVIFIVLIFIFLTHAIAGSFGNYPVNEETQIVRKNSFLYASRYLNPEEVIIEENYTDADFFENSNIILQNSAFLGVSSPAAILSFPTEKRSGIITYEVQAGDVPSQIAAAFGISTNTLLWANNLSAWDYIKPGQKLVILPVSGIRHKVKKGETLDKIVKKYKGDVKKTIEFNGLPADGSLAVNQEIIIPDGKKPVYYYPRPRSYASSYSFPRPYSGKSRRFPWGQCTWYVAQRRYVPWSGDAKDWLSNAERLGYSVCRGWQCQPRPGAIIALRGNTWIMRRYGHVAYVENVKDGWITFSEMNYLGRGVKSIRSIPQSDWRIIGYIY